MMLLREGEEDTACCWTWLPSCRRALFRAISQGVRDLPWLTCPDGYLGRDNILEIPTNESRYS